MRRGHPSVVRYGGLLEEGGVDGAAQSASGVLIVFARVNHRQSDVRHGFELARQHVAQQAAARDDWMDSCNQAKIDGLCSKSHEQ